MTSKIIVAVVIIVVGLFLFWGKSASSPMALTVGVSQFGTGPVYEEIKAGIVQAFKAAGYEEGSNIAFDFQDAQGDQAVNASIAQKFASSDYSLFIPLGTPPSQALYKLVKDQPIVFGAVTDPISAGLVSSTTAGRVGSNVTGTSDVTLYKEQLALLKKLVPGAKKIGIAYNPGEANARYGLEQAKLYGIPMGFEFIVAPANTTAELLPAAQSIADKVDAFYMLPDNTEITGQEALIKVTREHKKPFISLDQSGVEKGALATLGTNYKKVGERTGEIAVRVLKGEKPETIEYLGVTDADLFINTKTAQVIGLTISPELLSAAKQTY